MRTVVQDQFRKLSHTKIVFQFHYQMLKYSFIHILQIHFNFLQLFQILQMLTCTSPSEMPLAGPWQLCDRLAAGRSPSAPFLGLEEAAED